MPKRISCLSVRTKVAERCQLGTLNPSSKPTITYVNSVIVQAFDSLATKLRNGFGDDWMVESEEVTLQGDTNELDVIDDFVHPVARIKKVAWVRSTTEVQPIRRANMEDVFRRGVQSVPWQSFTPLYKEAGDKIVFYPTPSEDVILFFQYSTGFDIADDLNSTITVYPGWEEWVINESCRVIRVGQDKDSSRFAQARDDAWENIVTDNQSKDEWETPRVRDVQGGGWPGEDRFPVNGFNRWTV